MLSKGIINAKQAADMLNASVAKGAATAKEAGSSFSNLSNCFNQFTAANLAASAISSVVSGIESFISESGKAFREAEKNSTILRYAVTSMAGGTKSDFEDLESTVKTSLYGLWTKSDVEKATAPMIEEYGMTASTVKKLIPLIGTFSTMSGKSFDEAAISIARATHGMGRDFKAMGVNLLSTQDATTAAANEETNLASITDFLSGKMGVMGEYAETSAGKLQQMTTQLEEQKEKLGEVSTAWDLWYAKAKTNIFKSLGYIVNPSGQLQMDYEKNIEESVTKNLQGFKKETYIPGNKGEDLFKENWDVIKEHQSEVTSLQAQINKLESENTEYSGISTISDLTKYTAGHPLNQDMVLNNLSQLMTEREVASGTYKKMLAIQTASDNPKSSFYTTPSTPEANSSTTLVKGNTPTNIYITIDNLVREFNIETTNISTAEYSKIESMVAQALVSAVNDANQLQGK
jgi:hypothetical protein